MIDLPEGYSRRLVGPNLFFSETGTVLDIPLKSHQQELVNIWQNVCKRVLTELNWGEYKLAYKIYNGGLRLAFTAPVDILLAACDVIDYTWKEACYRFLHKQEFVVCKEAKDVLQKMIKAEQNPAYRVLYAKAKTHGVNVFRDGDEAYVGSGVGRYKVSLLTDDYLSIPWQDVYDVPAVIVTGTNGKTTTVRLTYYICQQAGKLTGYASTDWVVINDQIIGKGDYSGPTGHQFVLTNPQVEIAVLESARGGLLKRGLIETQVKAATITNVSPDHMGEDGVETLQDLIEAKCIVYRGLAGENAYAVINLDDVHLASLVNVIKKPNKILISKNPIEVSQLGTLSDKDKACYVKNNVFIWWENYKEHILVKLTDVPLTINGAAKHNIENTLHAIALAYALGISLDDIGHALTTYKNDINQNQGRANIYELQSGATVIVDFAHNPAGLDAILSLARHYCNKDSRLSLMLGTTGDRINLIDDCSRVVVQYQPSQIFIKELKKYLRGAKLGEIPQKVAVSLAHFGIKQDTIFFVEDELSGAKQALQNLQSDDVCVLCCHDQITPVTDLVKTFC
ncbi:Mur ligase family protein [Fastidiosibacter lacustris]|uniref:Mur ligase family protein n=1 Tax=Fastidiosibacter lacustris TaxID=2056695 RepID=UPI000E34A8EF|nr:Mur ligase family protein [Fastidiosibacter lacustris]